MLETVNIFAKRVVREGHIPLDISIHADADNEENRARRMLSYYNMITEKGDSI